MKPIEFPEANTVLNKPDEMTDEECMPLPVCVCRDSEDLPLIISCWEPTAEEWDTLRKQGRIYIAIVSEEYHPPLIVFPGNPFDQAPDQPPINPLPPTHQSICTLCAGTGTTFNEITGEARPCSCQTTNSDKPTHE